jgi:Delta7-sterol 5-desaturase
MQPFIESIGKHYGIFPAWIIVFSSIFLRYALFASVAYFILYKWNRRNWFAIKIQQKFPRSAEVQQEVFHSLTTAAIFASMGFGVYFLRKMGFGSLYFNISDYGWGYYTCSIISLIVLHDTYFYWTHRLMHHPKLFKIFHKVHHRSHNPTPYSSFSFHPLEAIVEFGIVPFIALFMPLHISTLFVFTLWSMLFNIMGHSGYEFFPSGFTKHPIFKWLNTSTHHNLHHSRSGANYSLYFNFWDRVMGTNHPQYDEIFEKVKQQNLKSILMLLCFLSVGSLHAQTTVEKVKNGQYGTPQERAAEYGRCHIVCMDGA